ncbi:MAG: Hpt domain-containing protein, partial [Thermodesulfobacteriota bacterium]
AGALGPGAGGLEGNNAAAQGVFDESDLLRRVAGDKELLREMIGIFLEELPGRLSEIGKAVREGNAAALEASAHTLKGSVGYFSAPMAFEAVKTLVGMARAGRLDGADRVYQALVKETERLENDLRTWRDNNQAARPLDRGASEDGV